MNDESNSVSFYRRNIMQIPDVEDLLTMGDVDEHKLSSIDNLLKTICVFREKLCSGGLFPCADNEGGRWKNIYKLTDLEYAEWDNFEIKIKSNWLDPEWRIALHANFMFHLSVVQDALADKPREIADWIDIRIEHLNIMPISFASHREHVRVLQGFTREANSYFHDIPMESRPHVNFESRMTLKADAFNKAVEDACMVMRKIIARKKFLVQIV